MLIPVPTRVFPSAMKTEVCSVCHPFFTGTQRIIDTGGQVERFRRRAAAKTGKQPADAV